MKDFITNLLTRKLRIASNKVDIHQTDRNQLKADFMKGIADLLSTVADVKIVADGIGVEFENEDFGSIVFVVNAVVKGTDFDLTSEAEVFALETATKLAEKEAKEKAKATKVKTAKAKVTK